MKKVLIVLTLLAVSAIVITNCSKNSPVAPNIQPEQGKLMFALDAADNIASGTVTISKGSLTHALPIRIANHTGSVSFEGIQVGTWSITVQLFDAEGVEIYSGIGEAVVTKNQTTTVTIQVDHNTGNLVIIVEVPGAATPTPTPVSTEVITNGDFLLCSTPPFPDGWQERSPDHPAGDYMAEYLGRSGVMRWGFANQNPSRGGGHIKQIYIPPHENIQNKVFTITFYIVNATLAGDGWYGTESPIDLKLFFENTVGDKITFKRYYNYTHDSDSASNPNFELVNKEQWITKSYAFADINIPLEYKLTGIDIGASGWQMESYTDSVSIK